jgi:hypothetical protein
MVQDMLIFLFFFYKNRGRSPAQRMVFPICPAWLSSFTNVQRFSVLSVNLNKTIRCFMILFIILSNTLSGFSQERTLISDSSRVSDAVFVEANLHSGLVINNYVHYELFPKRHPSAILELKLGKQTTGTYDWQQYYGFPQANLSFFAGYLGNAEELGFLLGLIPTLTLNAIDKHKWSLKVTMGLGFSYFNKPYSELNKSNILIGSHITNMSIAKFHFRRMFTTRTDFNFGLSVIHASNGHIKLPNVGLNKASLFIGLKHYFDDRPERFYKTNSRLNQSRDLKFGIRLAWGIHQFGNELGPVGGPTYPVTDLAAYISKPLGSLGSASIGLGYKYYQSFYEKILGDNHFDGNPRLLASTITLCIAYEFEMRQVSLLAEGGLNVYNPYWRKFTELTGEQWTFYKQLEGYISTRLGLQYYLFDKLKYKKNMFVGMYIKANMGGADFAGIGLGFVL